MIIFIDWLIDECWHIYSLFFSPSWPRRVRRRPFLRSSSRWSRPCSADSPSWEWWDLESWAWKGITIMKSWSSSMASFTSCRMRSPALRCPCGWRSTRADRRRSPQISRRRKRNGKKLLGKRLMIIIDEENHSMKISAGVSWKWKLDFWLWFLLPHLCWPAWPFGRRTGSTACRTTCRRRRWRSFKKWMWSALGGEMWGQPTLLDCALFSMSAAQKAVTRKPCWKTPQIVWGDPIVHFVYILSIKFTVFKKAYWWWCSHWNTHFVYT